MTQTAWDPVRELAAVQERMNKLFERALARTNFDAEGGAGAWTPVSDVFETADGVVHHLELPGLRLDDIEVRVEEDELLVQGERRMDREQSAEFHRVERSYGKFVRRFPLPSSVERESVEALYRDGVLRVRLPKKGSESVKAIRVAVK